MPSFSRAWFAAKVLFRRSSTSSSADAHKLRALDEELAATTPRARPVAAPPSSHATPGSAAPAPTAAATAPPRPDDAPTDTPAAPRAPKPRRL
jgi:hypothetical protein